MKARDSIIGMLQHAGYRYMGRTVRVHGIELSFAGLFEGKKGSHDLVVVCDVVESSAEKCKSDLRALFTLLERTGSLRPVTVAAIVDNARSEVDIRELAHLCRLIVVDTRKQDLEGQLHALSAIPFPSPLKPGRSAEAALLEQLGDLRDDTIIDRLLKASQEDPEEVENTVLDIIRELISEEELDDEHDGAFH